MNVPDRYKRERKLQRLSNYSFAIAGVGGALLAREEWLRIILVAGLGAFSFIFFHTAYLGIKYSLVELTTGVYSRHEKPQAYYAIILVALLAGSFFLYEAVNV